MTLKDDLNKRLVVAINKNNLKHVNILINMGSSINEGLLATIRFNNREFFDFMINKGANNWNDAMKCACEYGHYDIVSKMIEMGAYNFDECLCKACLGGNIDIVSKMIEMGAKISDKSFVEACSKGHLNIVNLLFSKCEIISEYYANEALFNACNGMCASEFDARENMNEFNSSNYYAIMKLMIMKGASCWHDIIMMSYNVGFKLFLKYIYCICKKKVLSKNLLRKMNNPYDGHYDGRSAYIEWDKFIDKKLISYLTNLCLFKLQNHKKEIYLQLENEYVQYADNERLEENINLYTVHEEMNLLENRNNTIKKLYNVLDMFVCCDVVKMNMYFVGTSTQ